MYGFMAVMHFLDDLWYRPAITTLFRTDKKNFTLLLLLFKLPLPQAHLLLTISQITQEILKPQYLNLRNTARI